mmetsp:Transcript_42823/g.77051  ORF Transcript_42823/g.77051 Transcript_42823/m.77051 type:complete len:230 (+) Transcript_42823:1131-1820(+)
MIGSFELMASQVQICLEARLVPLLGGNLAFDITEDFIELFNQGLRRFEICGGLLHQVGSPRWSFKLVPGRVKAIVVIPANEEVIWIQESAKLKAAVKIGSANGSHFPLVVLCLDFIRKVLRSLVGVDRIVLHLNSMAFWRGCVHHHLDGFQEATTQLTLDDFTEVVEGCLLVLVHVLVSCFHEFALFLGNARDHSSDALFVRTPAFASLVDSVCEENWFGPDSCQDSKF